MQKEKRFYTRSKKARLHVDRPTKHDQGYAGGDTKTIF